MNLETMIESYVGTNYSYEDAASKVAQDILLLKISKSSFSKNITVKGGVVIHSISKDIRRATRDIDLDFIKYSLEDGSIINFINELNNVDDGINISIAGTIKKLHHQDYDGKRVNIKISDKSGYDIYTKLDIGIHKQFDIEQDEYCFCFDIIDKHANLLINSKEQIFTEKLKSLLKLGFRSTRYKDLFDFYYLINTAGINKEKLYNCFTILIFENDAMKENNLDDILLRLKQIFNSKRYYSMLNEPKINWLSLSVDEVITNVLNYLCSLEDIIV